MADGKVVYKVEVDDSSVTSDIKKTEQKIKSSSQSAANAQKKDNKSVVEDAKQSTGKVSGFFKSAFEEIKEGSGSLKDVIVSSFDDIASSVGLSAGSLAKAGLVGGFAAIGAAGVQMAADVEGSMNRFAAQTGLAGEELKEFEDTLQEIYTNGYGESLDDVADAAARIKQQFGDISAEEMQNLTEGALTLRDTLDMDLNETIRGAEQLMKQFGITSDEAMDLMASGAQNGLNYTDELGDNISEYSGKFAQAGYSAEEYFQLLANGSQGGAYNLDKVNDAINEVTTRLADGTIEESLDIYSKGTQDLFRAWQNGEATQKDVIDSIVKDIQNCDNEQQKLTMSATAFGTMGEDANAKFIESLSSVGDTFEDVNGTMDEVSGTMKGGVGASFEKFKRNIEALMVPIGQLLLPGLNAAIEVLTIIISVIANVISAFTGWITNVEGVSAAFHEILGGLASWFNELIDGIVSWFTETWNGVATWWNELWAGIGAWFQETWQGLSDWFNGIVQGIRDFFVNNFSEAFASVMTFADDFLSGVKQVIDGVKQIFQGIIDFIVGVFTGDWSRAWEGVKSVFSGIINGIAGIFKAPINAIIDGINSFIDGVNSISIPDWVPVVGGASFNIPKIPRLKVGMDFVPNDYFPAFLDYGEAVLTREENAKFRALGGVVGMENMLRGNDFMGSNLNIDYDRLAAAMANIGIYMDSERVGYLVTGGVDKNMGLTTSRKGRFSV